MKCGQILEILDSRDFFELDGSDRQAVEAHCETCGSCMRAAGAARAASSMLRLRAEGAAEMVPSAFFGSVVMNAVRAAQRSRFNGGAFKRWWQASYSLVSVMVVLVLALIAGAMLAPTEESEAVVATPSNLYPTETVLIDHRPSRDLDKEQIFQVIYNTRYEAKK